MAADTVDLAARIAAWSATQLASHALPKPADIDVSVTMTPARVVGPTIFAAFKDVPGEVEALLAEWLQAVACKPNAQADGKLSDMLEENLADRLTVGSYMDNLDMPVTGGLAAARRVCDALASFEGSTYVYSVFHRNVLACLRDHLLRKWKVDGDDVWRFLKTHAFQPDILPRVVRIAENVLSVASSIDDAKLADGFLMLRYYACYEFTSYATTCATLVQNSPSSCPPDPASRKSLEDCKRQLLCWGIELFGSAAIYQLEAEDEPRVDKCMFQKALAQCLDAFRDALGTAGPVLRQDASAADPPDPIPGIGSFRDVESRRKFETLVSHLMSKDGGSLKVLDAQIRRREFRMVTQTCAAPLRCIKVTSHDLLAKMFTLYFPLKELGAANLPAQAGMPTLQVGRILNSAEGILAAGAGYDAQVIAYSWSDYSATLIYALKFLRFLTQLASLHVTVRVFREAYVRSVYAQRGDPPLIWAMLGLFLGIDLTAQVVLVLLLILLTSPGGGISNLVNDNFMVLLLTDALASSAAVGILGAILAKFVWRKTYFQYKKNGVGTIKCYADMLVGVCAVAAVVPFFMLA